MKKIYLPAIIFALLWGAGITIKVYGYGNVYAHPAINVTIIDEFKRRLPENVKNSPTFGKFKNYIFLMDMTDLKGTEVYGKGQWYITERTGSKNASSWIEHGGMSADEPEITASLRHFYDPVMNEKVLYLTNTGANPPYKNPCIDAIHWAFVGTDLEGNNQWTWNKGKEFMILALEEKDKSKKEENLGKAMRCLGEVLHNTADMGLPAHVRNDAHGGWWYFGGGTDPYESLFNPDWCSLGMKACDPDLSAYFRNAKTAKDINKRMAEFTNKNFFSHETISGMGVKEYSSANGYKNYPSPKLQDFEFRSESNGYYKKFASGREVKMCVDKSLLMSFFSLDSRSTPYVDYSCVKSQAEELLPDIVEAGINVIRNFIPEFEINISANANTDEVSGTVYHLVDNEYSSSIGYSGEVTIYVNSKSKSVIMATDGKFSGSIHGLKNGDKVIAKISFADITISSNELKVDPKTLNLLNMGEFKLRGEIVWTQEARVGGYVRAQFPDWQFNSKNSSIEAGKLVLNTPFSDGFYKIDEFNVSFNTSTQKVEKFTLKCHCYIESLHLKQVFEISLDEPADNPANWYTAGGCDLMYLNLNELQKSKVSYTDKRYIYQKLTDGSGNSDYVLDKTFTAKDLINSDGFGHLTSIRFSSSTTK